MHSIALDVPACAGDGLLDDILDAIALGAGVCDARHIDREHSVARPQRVEDGYDPAMTARGAHVTHVIDIVAQRG